jgi:hypothetical protein
VAWTTRPSGTIDNLGVFTGSGTLAKAEVSGVQSATPPNGCWPFHRGKAVIPFPAPAPAGTGVLLIGYRAGASASGETVTVSYRGVVSQFVAAPGLNSVYLQVTGSASGVTVTAAGALCVGDVEAGNLAPSAYPLVPMAG